MSLKSNITQHYGYTIKHHKVQLIIRW